MVVPVAGSEQAQAALLEWRRGHVRLLAPDLWLPEALSGIQKLVFVGAVTSEQAETLVPDFFRLGIESVVPDADLCRKALGWAGRLNQAKAYDALYVALAERESTPLYTADARLARGATQAGATWVHQIG